MEVRMAGNDKMTFEIDVRDLASERIKQLEREFEKLGGKAALEAVQGMNRLERSVNTLHKAAGDGQPIWTRFTQGIAVGTIAANAAMKAFDVLKDIIVDSVKAALDEEAQWNRVAGSIKAAGGQTTITLKQVKDMTDALEEQTGVADTLISAGFSQMIRAGIGVNTQWHYMKIALDAAAASGRDVQNVLDLIIKASVGAEGALERLAKELGVGIEKGDTFATVMIKLADVTSGAAVAGMAGAEGAVKSFHVSLERLEEAAGSAATGVLGFWRTMQIGEELQELEATQELFKNLIPAQRVDAITSAIEMINLSIKNGIGGIQFRADLQAYTSTRIARSHTCGGSCNCIGDDYTYLRRLG
jgi:hypothetical protein